MLLTEVKTYLSARGRASLDDLAVHFCTEPEAMRGLVETWVAKGRVRRVNEALPCGTCGKCDSATSDVYEWVGSAVRLPSRPCGS
jgi:hypothetical protein